MSPRTPPERPRPGPGILYGVTLATVAAVAVASFFPGERLWGFNHLAFYPPAVRYAAIAVMALSLLPPVARPVYAGLLSLSRRVHRGGPRVEPVLMVVVVFSAVVFAGLSASTNLLGDGQLVADTFHRAVEDPGKSAFATADWISPGTNLLYYGAARLATAKATAVDGIRYLNCLLGMIFMYVFLGLIREGGLSDEQRLWAVVMTLFSGVMQLFFGYIETYTPLVFLLFLYMLSSMRTLHGRGHVGIASALLVAAVFVHVQALIFVPSLAYLLIRGRTRDREAAETRATRALLLLIPVGAIAVAAFTPLQRYFLPLTTAGDTPGLLSFAHWADVGNELMLLMPALPIVLVMMILGRRPEPGGSGNGAATWFSRRSEWRFVTLVLTSCVVYLAVFNPAIGMVRDWDLFAMTALGLIPLSLLALGRVRGRFPRPIDAAPFALPALVLTAILTSSWIGVNASASRSTARFERMFDYDRVHAPYAYENLATYYHLNGDLPGAIENLRSAAEISHNPRQYLSLAMYHDERGDVSQARDILTDVLQRRPTYHDARLVLVTILAREGINDELAAVARAGTRLHPEQATYWLYLGLTATANGDMEEGLAALRRCLALNPAPDLRTRALDAIRRYDPNG